MVMEDKHIGSLIFALSGSPELDLLRSEEDAQNCFNARLGVPDFIQDNLGVLEDSTPSKAEYISVVSKPTDPELKIIYTQNQNNKSKRPVGHWFISVCDTKNNRHDIDSRKLGTQKDSISCGLHTALNFILAKQELLKIALEPNGSSLPLNQIYRRIKDKVIGFNKSFRIDDFYAANIANTPKNEEEDWNDDLVGRLVSGITSFKEYKNKEAQEDNNALYLMVTALIASFFGLSLYYSSDTEENIDNEIKAF